MSGSISAGDCDERIREPVTAANAAGASGGVLGVSNPAWLRSAFRIDMSVDFHLIDLVSQAGAVRKRMVGKTDSEKLAWLATHGTLEPVVVTPHGRQTYRFKSSTGQETAFFFDDGELVFVGDHTTFVVSDE